ncbi:MATE efflux family protein [Perilla frutescens var. hirtella]|uniref:Protein DETOXIFICATION n=1 Tax=Perilla frutescens var. hirtella TaxID=608512 RepID=A0AAD4PE38_PERFH|nr:MATE efflux family protein [Perilla frutescens var. hirtella]
MDLGSGASSEAVKIPLLHKKTAADGWLKKVIDADEAKKQISLALPMILTNVIYYFIPLVSVMFAGHLGQLELAASNLANSWASASGFDLMVGLSGALETLCGQGFGGKMYRMLGVYLQASCIISTIFASVVSILWWHSEIVLIFLRQDPEIARSAAIYLKYLIPGLFAQGLLQHMLRFLQTQSVVLPLVVCATVPLLLHVGIAYVLVNWTSLGFRGAPFAASISLWISLLMLAFYVLNSNRFHHTWPGFTWDSFTHIFTYFKLALPSAAMVCLEYCAFEILVLLAGLMPDSQVTTSLIAMCVNAETVCFMIAYGLSAAISTRVSNELGGGNPSGARHATVVALKLTVVLAVCVVLALCLGHDLWAGLFSGSPLIMNAFASMTPLLVASLLFDFVQGILSGVARGCGWQHLVVFINIGSFYFIGMPVATILGFKFELHAKGLWIGLTCGLASQTIGLLLLTKFTKWRRIEFSECSSSKIVEPPHV